MLGQGQHGQGNEEDEQLPFDNARTIPMSSAKTNKTLVKSHGNGTARSNPLPPYSSIYGQKARISRPR